MVFAAGCELLQKVYLCSNTNNADIDGAIAFVL